MTDARTLTPNRVIVTTATGQDLPIRPDGDVVYLGIYPLDCLGLQQLTEAIRMCEAERRDG